MLISNTQCFTSEMKPGIKVFNLEMSTLFCILFTVPYSLGSPAGRLFTPKATIILSSQTSSKYIALAHIWTP